MEIIGVNTVFSCSLAGDVEALQRLLEYQKDSGEGGMIDMFQEKDTVGRNALFVSCMLGRCNIVRELVRCGANVHELTVRGYTPLHCAALWGHLDTVKTLVELGANLHAVNFRGESAKRVARRYSKMACAEYLSLAEAKQGLQEYIIQVRQTLSEDKVQGKLNKEEKNIFTSSCLAKADWIQNAKTPSIQDFTEQKKHLEDILGPLLAKLTAQSEATTKTRKH
ncbi:hypothetical protein AAFF_G00108030 [Aldrovandia affinis]|uniref:Ankyrin repeat domain-containing protein 45 n=1 Tax=Aldrovandia affinis TaxID=143900 RepID=A0AAD7RU22_9TELE|nr:hypothetical protein AAFF_G00108030 [Aldrovandia affinis]